MSMLLKAANGNEFELSFTRDALPDPQDGFGDATWATVVWRAATADADWEETSPCMNLYEFGNLADWLEAAAGGVESVAPAPSSDDFDANGSRSGRESIAGAPEVSEVELLEPELRFTATQFTPDAVTVRIYFHLADRPEEFSVDAGTDEAEFMDMHVPRENLIAAAATLRRMLAEFEAGRSKDDLTGDDEPGQMGAPEPDLNLVDSIERDPPGAGSGEDNAGRK